MDEYQNSLELKNVSTILDGFSLKNINFNIPKGTIMGFVGQNGAGKTTTIKTILKMFKANEGTIKFFGLDINEHEKEIKDRIAVVFDEIPYPKELTPLELNVVFNGLFSKWNKNTFFSYLERFNLPKKKKISEFSRGMTMKLQIAVSLSHEADLLILDEATSGLDPVVRSEMLDVFLEYIQDENHSILISSHITSDLERIADSITFINDGKIILSGEKDEILSSHHLLKISKEDLIKIDEEDIISIKKSDYNLEILVKNYKEEKYASLVSEKPTFDEILLFYVKGSTSKEWIL